MIFLENCVKILILMILFLRHCVKIIIMILFLRHCVKILLIVLFLILIILCLWNCVK